MVVFFPRVGEIARPKNRDWDSDADRARAVGVRRKGNGAAGPGFAQPQDAHRRNTCNCNGWWL
jgi:hypothetical protein